MPHERKRHLFSVIERSLKASPIVGVIGHRQTGKTMLCSHFSQSYTTLDRESDLQLCESSPLEFIKNRGSPFIIDECQLSPRLFPALKEHVRTQKRVGQFLLSGSVRFTSRKAIRESLTGRILLTELLPMTWSESHDLSINPLLTQLHKKGIKTLSSVFTPRLKGDEQAILNFVEKGGLPGICFSRNSSIRSSRFKSHLDTILDRDLRLILETSLPKMSLLALLGSLAGSQGVPLNWEKLRRQSGISVITLKKLFSAFEALFILRPINLIGKAIPDSYFFEDTGLAHYLSPSRNSSINLQAFSHFLYCNLRESYHYRDDTSYAVQSYRTKGGALVPIVFNAFSSLLGIIPALDKQPTLSSIRSAESFLNQNPTNEVVIVHFGTEARMIHPRLASLPWTWLI